MTHRSSHTGAARPLDWRAAPADVVAAWPRRTPLAALIGADGRAPWSRWSILAEPRGVAAASATRAVDLLATLASPAAVPPAPLDSPPLPFQGGRLACLSYDLGRVIEPAAASPSPRAVDDRAWPDVTLLDCPSALIFDHHQRQWWAVGPGEPPVDVDDAAASHSFQVGDFVSGLGHDDYVDIVERGLEHIAAGDVFQVNLARRLSAPFEGSPRGLFLRMLEIAAPWYGALLEWPDQARAAVSMSPELFLRVDGATGSIATRPIKGTRPAGAPPDDLTSSEKDRAELTMIVDLMRNDLGRVCRFGSIHAPRTPSLERHGGRGRHASAGVVHTVGAVEGTLRPDVAPLDLVRAAFPPGSVTGAPKIRAMQLIDELEPVRRGPYCGAIGYFSDCGGVGLSVAIRTASVTGEAINGELDALRGVVDYSVGAGIVADSDPESEWRETQAKAAGFLRAAPSPQLHAAAPAAGP